jgi:hypothetical protein
MSSLKSRSYSTVAVFGGILAVASALSLTRVDAKNRLLAASLFTGSGAIAITALSLGKSIESELGIQHKDRVTEIALIHTTELQKLHSEKSACLNDQSKLKQKLEQIVNAARTAESEYQQRLQQFKSEVSSLQLANRTDKENAAAEYESLKRAYDRDINEYKADVDELRELLLSDLNNRIAETYSDLVDRVNFQLEKNPENITMTQFATDMKQSFQRHSDMITVIDECDLTPTQLLRAALSSYHRINDEVYALKTRFKNTLNTLDRKELYELRSERDQLVPRDKAKGLLGEYAEFQAQQLAEIKALAADNDASLSELASSVSKLLDTIDDLEHKLADALKPQAWSLATTPETQKGNIIINFFNAKGILLDRSHYLSDGYSCTLHYQIDRNPRAVLPKEFNEHAEELQQYARLIEVPKFTYNGVTGLLECSVQLKIKPKESKKDKELDISKRWIPATKFESYVKNFERIRITAGSTGGKSPTAKNLALAIMNARKGKGSIHLYDPQHGSKKDFWNMPKHGTSHEDNLKGMQELCGLIDSRRNGSGHEFRLYIFDEIDNTVANLEKSTEFKNLLKISIKEGSHCDLGVIYIGQSADANEIPGMTHSNWNNVIQIHIGSNAGSVIERLTTITNEEKTSLRESYRLLQEYCESKNEELGLDIFTDPQAYRFALCVPLTGLPKFIQLPDYDTYDYEQVMGTQQADENSLSQKSESSVRGTCPKCGSSNIGSKNADYHRCKDCGKTWKRSN